jgi:predicted site-specific integrase-resolvase
MKVLDKIRDNKGKARAVVYARFSSDNQRDESIDAKLRAINEYAKRNDIIIVAECIRAAMKMQLTREEGTAETNKYLGMKKGAVYEAWHPYH